MHGTDGLRVTETVVEKTWPEERQE